MSIAESKFFSECWHLFFIRMFYETEPPSVVIERNLSQRVSYLEVKSNGVDGDDGTTGVVLQGSSQEGLREEETRDPEDAGDTFVDPRLNKLHPLHQIGHPGGQWLQGWVCLR